MVLGSGFDLGTAYGRIILSLDDSAVGNARASIGAGLKDIGDSVRNVGASLTTLTAPVLAFGLTGLKAASDFDTVINQIRVFGELGPQDLERVRQAALKWGADTKFSALDASAGMLDLLKSGQSVEQAMQTMTGVLNLAGAGNLNLAQSAGIVSSALAQFRLGADQSGMVANSLAKAANASRAEVGGLGDALVQVGPVAANFGLSIDETNAVLATFANNGIMGADAGTKLRSMLTNMTETTKPVKDAWNELGLSLYDSQGNLRDFNTVLVELDTALDKLPVQRQNELMVTLAGTYGLTGLQALRASDGIGTMLGLMEAAPDAATVAAEQMNMFAGKVESLKGSIETLQIEALTPLMNEVLAPLVDKVIGVVNSLTGWIQANPELAGQIMQILAVLVTVGPVLVGVGMAISAVGSAISGLGTLTSIALGPMGLLVAALAGLVLAYQNNFLGIRDLVQPVIDQIAYAFTYVAQIIQGLLNGTYEIRDLFTVFSDGSSILGEFLERLLGLDQSSGNTAAASILETLQSVVGFIQDSVIPIVERFVGLLGEFWASIQPGLQAFASWVIADALPLVVDFFNTILRPAVEGIVNMLMDIWTVVQPALSALFNWFMAEGLPFITDALRWFMENILQPAITLLTGIWDNVGPVLQSVFDWFVTTGLPFINEALTWFKDNIVQPVVDVLAGIWNVVSPVVQLLLQWFVETGLPNINTALTSFKDNILNPVIEILKGIWTSIEPGVTALKTNLETIFNFIKDNIIQPIIDKINEFKNTLSGITAWQGAGQNAQTAFGMVQSGQVSVTDFFNAVGNAIGAEFGGSQDMGGDGMADVSYLIGRGAQPELFIPKSAGTFIPNADKLMGGMQFGPGSVVIYANSEAGGQAAAKGFEERINELLESRGRG